jgi:hypothetical protein
MVGLMWISGGFHVVCPWEGLCGLDEVTGHTGLHMDILLNGGIDVDSMWISCCAWKGLCGRAMSNWITCGCHIKWWNGCGFHMDFLLCVYRKDCMA